MSTTARPRLPRPRGTRERLAATAVAVAAAVAAGQMAVAAGRALLDAWPVMVAVAAGGLLCVEWRVVRAARARRARTASLARLCMTLVELDALDDGQFERALRDLLIRDGWRARHVGQQGDQAADVIAEHPRRGRIVIQAKHTRVAAKVGCSVLYQVNGTAGPVHGADVGIVVTNGGFTRNARRWGDRHRVLWVDRDRLRAWAERGVPLHDLLRLPRRPPRRARRLACFGAARFGAARFGAARFGAARVRPARGGRGG